MKHLMKTLIGTSAMMLVFGSCGSIPGSQEWKIKKPLLHTLSKV